MSTTIALISKLPVTQQKMWIQKFEAILPNEKFALASDIDDDLKASIEIAIVADPDLEVVKFFSKLKWVHSLWAGVENLIEIAKQQKFDIVRLIDPELANAMSEAVLTWVLYLHRKIPTYVTQQQHKIWQQHAYTAASQCKVGLLGLGELGKASAHRLTSNGFEVLGWSQSEKILSSIKSYHGKKGLVEMLEQCQILICLLPLTKSTYGLVNKNLLSHLPQGASLINFSRGGIVNTEDLLSELDSKRLYHAVLDVFEQEPLPTDSKIWSNKRISILPHIAAATNPESAAQIIANNISNFRNKGSVDEFIDLDRGY